MQKVIYMIAVAGRNFLTGKQRDAQIVPEWGFFTVRELAEEEANQRQARVYEGAVVSVVEVNSAES